MFLFGLACSPSDPVERVPASTSDRPHLVRLTHAQWENTVVDLLGLSEPTGYSQDFVPDAGGSTFDNDASSLFVDPTLWQQYQSAAEGLAARVVAEPDLYDHAVPADLRASRPGAKERDQWLTTFGREAFRRPLVGEEQEELVDVFESGAGIFGSGDPFLDGVHASLVAMLQSPAFVYRFEGVYGPVDGIELPPDDLATKLSYALWNTLPDAGLRTAAESGLGPDVLADQVDRMLAAPAAHAMVADLHRQLLHVDSYQNIYRPSEEVLGIDVYEASTPASMQRELYAFVDDVVFGGGTVRDLLTSSHTFVDDRLAAIYGVPGLEDVLAPELVAVDLDPTRRAGLLTLSGFLAWEAGRTEPNLIERGAFVNGALLCVDVPPPPPNVPALPPPDDTGRTLRQRIEDHTSTCGAGCHTELINPIGYAFGKYAFDATWLDQDQGQPVDATGTYAFEDGTFSYDGAVDLAWVLADRPQVHRCYVSHLLGYLEGRSPGPEDEDQLEALTAASMDQRPILGLITDIVTSERFRQLRDP